MVPRAISPAKFLYSANSENGLIIMAAAVSSAQGADAAMTGMMKRVNLVRIQPTEASPYEVWYMQENSDAFGDVTMVRGETCSISRSVSLTRQALRFPQSIICKKN